MVAKVNNKLDGSYGELSRSILDLSGSKLEEVINNHEQFRQTQQKRLLDVQVSLANLAVANSDASSSSQLQTVTNGSFSKHIRTVEMEKCKAPTFSVKTIDYPEFKRGWCKVAASAWDEDNQIEQMKYKVDAYTKRIISRCKDLNEVWEALDNAYGQEEEVVNAVNMELKALKSEMCSTPEYVVKLRNFLPGLEEALKSVNGLEHLQTPDKVNYLVEKFDERTQYDWEYYKSEASGKTYDRFFSFILDRYDSCRSTIARIKSYQNSSINSLPLKECTNCHTEGHSELECLKGESINHNKVEMSCYRCKRWIRSCPVCGSITPEGESIGRCLEHCSRYVLMTANQCSDCVRNAKWCPVHLSSTHELSLCTQKNDPKLVCGINSCDKHHHRSLHGSTTPFIVGINSVSVENNENVFTGMNNLNTSLYTSDKVLLSMQTVNTPSGDINCFFDDGSTCCLILNSTAERLDLKGEDVVITLSTINGDNELQTKSFHLDLGNTSGNKETIKAFGVGKISGAIKEVNLDDLMELFSPSIQQLWYKIDSRPTGEFELLVGNNYSGLHPYRLESNGNIKLSKSKFGSGDVISGSHHKVKSNRISWDTTVSNMHVNVNSTHLTYKSVRDYLDSNELHVQTPHRCKNCMNCKECTFRGHQMSLQEQYEYQVMENNVVYDKVSKVFRVKYRFTEDPSILTNNLRQVIKIAEREERISMKNSIEW